MAKRTKEKLQDESIPDLDTLLSDEPPAPGPDRVGADMTDEELLGDMPPPPLPDGRPRTGRRVRVAARGGKTKDKGKAKPPAKRETRFSRAVSRVRSRMRQVIPQDPVERMRFKLRWLGIIKFPISFIIIAILTILTMLYLWYIYFDYTPDMMVYSRTVPVLVIFVPVGVVMFSAIYFPLNILGLNRLERRMTARLKGMLDGSIPLELRKGAKGGKARTRGPEETEENPPPSRSGA